MSDDRELRESLEKINNRLNSIDATLIRQEESLKLHIYRTELLEEAVESIRHDVEPLKKSKNMMEGAFNLLGKIGMVVAILAGIAKIASILVR